MMDEHTGDVARLTADQLCKTPLIEDLVPTNEEWDATEVVQDRYNLMKRCIRRAFARAALSPTEAPPVESQAAEIARLREALENLTRSAGEVSRLGATVGNQWVKLSAALVRARAALAAEGSSK